MAIIVDGNNQPMSSLAASSPSQETSSIKDTTAAHFMRDVIEMSQKAAVIVDFWAPWCEPCKALGPLLERLVRQTKGAVHMVKVNVDQERQLAAQFRVQSVPTVYAFRDGRPVDGFAGMVPEQQIRQFISRLGGASPADVALEEAQGLLDAGDVATARDIFRAIWEQEPTNAKAAAGFLETFIVQGDFDSVQRLFAQIPEDVRNDTALKAVRLRLDLLAESSRDAAPLSEAESDVARNPDDLKARYALALAHIAANRFQDAVSGLLEILRRDRQWEDGKARRQLLKMFEALGSDNPVTIEARRQLSSLLFS